MPQYQPFLPASVKVSSDQLTNHLAKALSPIYLIAGDEILLANEAADAVRAKARKEGFTERELHFVERGFDWAELRAASRTLSLFAERKIVELRMPSGAPGEHGAEVLIEMAEERSPDTLVLVLTGKLDGRTQNARWVSAIEKHGAFVQVWPVELPRLSAWIRERLDRAAKREAGKAAMACRSNRPWRRSWRSAPKAISLRPIRRSKSWRCWSRPVPYHSRRCSKW